MNSGNTQEINEEGALSIRGAIPAYPDDDPGHAQAPGHGSPAANKSSYSYDKEATSFWLRKSILTVNQIQALYSSLTDDGHLVGVERFELIAALDDGLNHFVQLRRVLDGRTNLTATHPRYDFRMLITVRGQSWQGQGRLGRYQRLSNNAFRMWLSRLRKERLPALIKFLGQAVSDGVLDQRERLILDRSIDRMIFGFILVRENVTSGRVG
ncbi:MAG: hypothetical protein NXI24_21360 [bacterium]|nr:hypothetical protein [bacterium]